MEWMSYELSGWVGLICVGKDCFDDFGVVVMCLDKYVFVSMVLLYGVGLM